MAKLLMLSGLPASGKSTYAEEVVRSGGNWVRLNKDLLRTMLHFDKFNGRNESFTKEAEHVLAEHFLREGLNVIVDDTNLNPNIQEKWKMIAEKNNVTFEHKHFDVEIAECVFRDSLREKKVGERVICQMAMQYGLWKQGEKGLVLFDLDGTLADIDHRLHFVRKVCADCGGDGTNNQNCSAGGTHDRKDWKSFFEGIPYDRPRKEIFEEVIQHVKNGYNVMFVSARPEDYRRESEEWIRIELAKISGMNPTQILLFMRRSGDTRPDTEVKKSLYDTYFAKYRVVKVFDDRPSVIRMWRELGLEVVDVGQGKEF